MLQHVKKSRASRIVVAAAIVSMGAMTVATVPSPAFAEDQGARNPNGFYPLGLDPWEALIFPLKIFSRLLTLPVGAFAIPDDYEMQ